MTMTCLTVYVGRLYVKDMIFGLMTFTGNGELDELESPARSCVGVTSIPASAAHLTKLGSHRLVVNPENPGGIRRRQ